MSVSFFALGSREESTPPKQPSSRRHEVQLLACCRHLGYKRAQPGECILLGFTILFSCSTGSVQQTASVGHGGGRADEGARRRYSAMT